eukprot:scaffold6362_cov378-Prasinococcus_capsulatus_cf.AAC.2
MHLHHREEELPGALVMSVEALSAAFLEEVALGHKKADVIHKVYSPPPTDTSNFLQRRHGSPCMFCGMQAAKYISRAQKNISFTA